VSVCVCVLCSERFCCSYRSLAREALGEHERKLAKGIGEKEEEEDEEEEENGCGKR
jgi:hypothetical protein